MKKVITWQNGRGKTIDVCKSCERKLGENWPKDDNGREYCQASRGLHRGECDICEDN